jgi:tetratricopeptide (TPR) repeat protein
MKPHTVLFAAALTLALPAAAQAQTAVTREIGLGHDCFLYAKGGFKPVEGVQICNMALRREKMDFRDRAATHDNRGVILAALGRTEAAKVDFNDAIRLDPRLGDPYVNIGAMLIKERRYEEALAQINKGLELGTGFPHIGYYDRALAYDLLGRYREAYYDYKKAVELEPGFTLASERLKDFTVTRAPGG